MLSLYLLAASTLFPGGFPAPEKANPVQVLAVPRDEHGYGGFRSLVIDSHEQFDSFKKTVEEQSGWNDRDRFLQVLDQARIDFARESLVLIRQGDGSSSQSVRLAAPRVRGHTLTCTVHVTGSPYNRDFKHRCFAVTVEKRKINRVEVWVKEGWTGKLQETLVVGKQ